MHNEGAIGAVALPRIEEGDCGYVLDKMASIRGTFYVPELAPINMVSWRHTPAWSLGRLLELIKHSDICNYNDFGCIKLYIDLDDFETCITMISYMVKEGYFNKEYLV